MQGLAWIVLPDRPSSLADQMPVTALPAALAAPRTPAGLSAHIKPTLSPLAVASKMLDFRAGADMQRSPRDREAWGESKAAMTRFSIRTTGTPRSLRASQAIQARAAAPPLTTLVPGGSTW